MGAQGAKGKAAPKGAVPTRLPDDGRTAAESDQIGDSR
jgi:hypothetical protein